MKISDKQRVTFPLFWRIFLLIWLALATAIVVSNLATRELMDREREAIERLEGLRDVAVEAARLRRGDNQGEFWRYLRSQGERLDLHLMLVDVDDAREQLPDSVRERMRSWYHRKPAVIEVSDTQRLVAWPRSDRDGRISPAMARILELSLGLILLTIACWWIARLVSRPLRHMESTAQAIAGGDLSLRVNERIARRRDEIGLMARSFNAMTERLCNLLDRQTQLMRDISHDLRTPLARQRVAIELAADNGVELELIRSIQRQNERLEEMTGQILTLYRVSAGDGITREPVPVIRAIHDVLLDAADYAEHQRVDCHFEAGPDCQQVTVLANGELLRRGLDNILQNALDYTPPGKSVTVGLQREGDWLRCRITDQGPGAPEAEIPHLFEPFYRADKARSGKGWGLGLAIARDIVLAHDGRIDAANAPGGGLQVTLWLPVFTGPDDPSLGEAEAGRGR
ncbi:Signal transduction histidine kinase [Marinobacter daqiaonensis]|uniref:histidine kinase n=1 Tax=Marinobacter daqiaonensis TaxID=650891 RepID=A0A1I6HLB3_9GAMM|nr:HAMP domain-containing sensor histidine kinase [Marinobacter daqiaonensis]SFR55259.1 Signal transduction histidine kinase [Marinobacter daqiaonensis]